jgi:TusA-related sulfurtransferase
MNRKNNLPDYFLDITQDVCPMTFVKARLQIEKMNIGEFLEIRLQGPEPLKNVPDSLTELGHRIHSVDSADLSTEAGDESVYQLIVEKI